MKNKLTTKEIISRIKTIYGNKYDCSKVEYNGIYEKITVICPIHGEFNITPNNFINLHRGCPQCGHISRWDKRGRVQTEDIIKRARIVHGDKYDYSESEYNGFHTKMEIICPIHGSFWQEPSNHLNGNGCPKCVKEVYDTNSFIEKSNLVHNYIYDYSKSKFVSSRTKTIVTCKKHGDFLVTPNNHVRGKGCPICKNSSLEEKTRALLQSKNIIFEQERKFEWLRYKNPMSVDFYLPQYNIAIECQGRQHYIPIDHFGGKEAFDLTVKRDDKKKQLLEENGIKLYYINYDDDIETKLNEILK